MKTTAQNPNLRLTPWNGTELDQLVGGLLEGNKAAGPQPKNTRPRAGTDTVYFQTMRKAELAVLQHEKK
jgi:hypothetical protein